MRYLLGIESSCDDTSVAIVSEKRDILANIVSSQIQEHVPYGGVVPELASRAHLQNIEVVFGQAMNASGLSLDQLSGVAVTQGPGLVGSLMVGIHFAKGLALGRSLPILGVNHIRGHVAALFLEHGDIPLPAMALIVSGGHTHLFRVEVNRDLTLLTKTRDDSAGEAFDKLSKMLNLGFPGGPIVDRLAREGAPQTYSFSFPRFSDGSRDYSFSGLKTAAMRHIQKAPEDFADPEGTAVKNLCASFQAAVVHQLLNRVRHGLRRDKDTRALLLGGGVACNSALRSGMTLLGEKSKLPAYLTARSLSTDNAAMIAAEGWRLFEKGAFAGLDLQADISLKAYDAVRLI